MTTRQPDRRGRRLVVWDLDRTLTRSDTLVPFLRAVAGSAWPRVTAQVASDVAVHGGSRAQLKDALLRRTLAGRSVRKVDVVANAFARWIVAEGCRADALARWDWHLRCGDTLALASASLALYVRPVADLLGTDLVIATELAADRGLLTGERATPNCRGGEKARRIGALVDELRPDTVWAYSDSASDRAMLSLADVPVRVRPWRRLDELVAAG
ncbi:HAD-IB family hydrolase [Cellulomonas sp. P5_C6]